MDPINKGLILGGATLAVALIATMMLGSFMEQRAADDVDQSYSPAREATVSEHGWRRTEGLSDPQAPKANPPG